MLSTSFALPPAERRALDQLKDRTGVAKANIVRRLIAFYASGGEVPSLPKIDPPINNPITRK
jgi:predicted DNA-binding protein